MSLDTLLFLNLDVHRVEEDIHHEKDALIKIILVQNQTNFLFYDALSNTINVTSAYFNSTYLELNTLNDIIREKDLKFVSYMWTKKITHQVLWGSFIIGIVQCFFIYAMYNSKRDNWKYYTFLSFC